MNNNKLNILLTRPLKKSQQLANSISSLANHIEITPLFAYQMGEQQSILKQQLKDDLSDIVIFISPASAKYAVEITDIPQHLINRTIIAVGKSTAEVLHAAGLNTVTVPEVQTSEGILQLEALQNVKDLSILIVRGNGGRELLKQQLQLRGAKVAYNEIYKRLWFDLNNEQTIEKWRKDKINCIVITSMELLIRTLSFVDDLHWAQSVTWVVASARIEQRALELGLPKVINALGASNNHIFKALSKLNETTI